MQAVLSIHHYIASNEGAFSINSHKFSKFKMVVYDKMCGNFQKLAFFFCIHHRPDGRNLFPRLEGYFYENILTVRKPRRYLYMFTTSLPK